MSTVAQTNAVMLTWQEVALGAAVGVRRRLAAMIRARPEPYGWPSDRDTWGSDIEAACAEMAVAKRLGRYWLPLADNLASLEGDVGSLQVRSTARSDGCLILHERDADDATFALVTGRAPLLVIAGTISGRDGKQPSWWRTDTGRPAFFVPQSALTPLDEGTQ